MNYEAILRAVLRQPAETWVALSYFPIAFMFAWALWKADRGDASTFKLIHFVTNDAGRGSQYALGYTVLVVTSAWSWWALVVLNRLTEWYVTLIIGGFVLGALGGTAAKVVSRIKGVTGAEPPADAGDADSPPKPKGKS